MSEFLYVVAIGVPVSAAICILHALITRKWDLVRGGLPVFGATALFGLFLIGLFS